MLIGGASITAVALGGGLTRSCASRPDGKIRPQSIPDGDLGPTLARLDAWYSAHLSPARYRFNPPASEQDLDAFQALVRVSLPNAYRQLYLWHDGDEEERFGHIYGLPLLSLREAAFQWNAWNGVFKEFTGNRYKVRGGAWPAGAVDSAYINPRWIPLTHDGSGNHIGLDFAPGPRGRVGQVILYGRDEDVKAVIAPSLASFLSWIADLLEAGNFAFVPGPTVLREFRLKAPAADSFMDAARALLGAPGPFL